MVRLGRLYWGFREDEDMKEFILYLGLLFNKDL